MALPVCDAAQQALEDQAAALLEKEGGCLPDDAFGDVLYCLRHGDAGPDATRNALCWLLAKLGMQSELASVPRCDGPPRTAAEQVEIDRRQCAPRRPPRRRGRLGRRRRRTRACRRAGS